MLLLPLALLGWRRPLLGGAMLLAVGLAPVLVVFAAVRSGGPSTVAIGIPATFDGVLFLLAALPRDSGPVSCRASVGAIGSGSCPR